MNPNDRILKIIEYSGLSSSEFAELLDVQRSSISHITSGRNKPSLEFVIKIKNRFPEIEWDWLINGEGEMLKPSGNPVPEEKTKSTSLPDLFSIIDDENFGKANVDKTIAREADIPVLNPDEEKISDSQRLINKESISTLQPTENQPNKIKKIVMFFENGRFESFEP